MATIKKYLWVAHLFAIAVCAYFFAQTVTAYLSGVLEGESDVSLAAKALPSEKVGLVQVSVDDYKTVIDRNIFNSEDVPVELEPPPGEAKDEDKSIDLSGPAVKTTLNIKVLGTLVVGEGKDRRSSATIVGGKSRKASVYYVKGEETFQDGVELLQVQKDRILFSNGGRLEYALLEGVIEKLTIFAKAEDVHGKSSQEKKRTVGTGELRRAAEPEASENAFVIDQREVDEALANLDRLVTEIRITPNFRGGQVAGMKVLAIKPGTIFSKLGLRRGDILERINGLELDIRRGMELFSQLKDQKNLRIDLVRRGKNKTLEYEIK